MIGAIAAVVLVVSLFLEWYTLSKTGVAQRSPTDSAVWVCGGENYSCSGFETFPMMRWFLLAGASAPLILAYILARGNTLSWPPGEVTMVVGFTALVLIGYNGIVAKPGVRVVGISLSWGYLLALAAAITIAGCGAWRASEKAEGRKPAGTP